MTVKFKMHKGVSVLITYFLSLEAAAVPSLAHPSTDANVRICLYTSMLDTGMQQADPLPWTDLLPQLLSAVSRQPLAVNPIQRRLSRRVACPRPWPSPGSPHPMTEEAGI